MVQQEKEDASKKTGEKRAEACTTDCCIMNSLFSKTTCCKKKIGVGLLAVVILIVVALSVGSSPKVCKVSETTFNSDKWISVEGDNANVSAMRLGMVKNLVEKTLYKGMTKNQILGLLGKAETQRFKGQYDMVYLIGSSCGALDQNTQWLTIKLKGGHFEGWKIITAPYELEKVG